MLKVSNQILGIVGLWAISIRTSHYCSVKFVMLSFDIPTVRSIGKPPKEYRHLAFPREQLVCKKFSYSNPTSQDKIIQVRSSSTNIVVKNPQLRVAANSSASIQLRMFFGRDCPQALSPELHILNQQTGQVQQQLRLCITLN